MPHDRLDIIEVRKAKSSIQKFILWPEMWNDFSLDLSDFKWKEYSFARSQKNNIPDSKGVYTFVIKPRVANHPSCGYLMYVGQTTDLTLRKRFGNYLDEQDGKRKSRPKIEYLLQEYKDFLFFVCMPLNDRITPMKVEVELLKAFIPPSNDALPAEVSRIVKAALS